MNTLPQIIIFCALGALIVFILIFIIKSIASPKKIEGIQRLLKQGKTAAAEKLAKTIIAKDPRDFVCHYWLGETYLAEDKTELGFMEFKLVNQNALFDGSIPELQFRKKIAALYLRFNQPEESLKEYLLLTKMEPHNADNFFNVGKIYESENRGDLALGFYQKAISIDRHHTQAHASLGYLLFRSKQFGEAKKEIDLAISLNPEAYSNYFFLGKILKENKDYSSALANFEKAERDPEYRQRALIERGSCYMAGNSLDNAIGEFEHAVKCAKDQASQETLFARYFLASCYEKSRQVDKAIAQWEKINSVNRNFRDVNSKLSEYRDLQSNDSMKEYLTCTADRFVEICKKTVFTMGLTTNSTDVEKFGCSVLATETKSGNWLNVRQQVMLLEFHRDTDPIEDDVIRRVTDRVKNQGYGKAYIFASCGFTHAASAFAENRPVELVDKEKLENLLTKAGI